MQRLSTRDPPQNERYRQIIYKDMEKHLSYKWKFFKKARVAILMPDKMDFKTKVKDLHL